MPRDLLNRRVMDQDFHRREGIQGPYPDCGWYQVIFCSDQSSVAVECYRREAMHRIVRFAQR